MTKTETAITLFLDAAEDCTHEEICQALGFIAYTIAEGDKVRANGYLFLALSTVNMQ